jgi:hypothetical protein
MSLQGKENLIKEREVIPMFNVKLTYNPNVIVSFDGVYKNRYIKETCKSLDEMITATTELLLIHNFTYADIIDAETGEVITTVERES